MKKFIVLMTLMASFAASAVDLGHMIFLKQFHANSMKDVYDVPYSQEEIVYKYSTIFEVANEASIGRRPSIVLLSRNYYGQKQSVAEIWCHSNERAKQVIQKLQQKKVGVIAMPQQDILSIPHADVEDILLGVKKP